MVAWRPRSRSVANAESAQTNELPAAEAGGGPLLAQIGTIHRTQQRASPPASRRSDRRAQEHRVSNPPARHRRVDERTNSAAAALPPICANAERANCPRRPVLHLGSAVLQSCLTGRTYGPRSREEASLRVARSLPAPTVSTRGSRIFKSGAIKPEVATRTAGRSGATAQAPLRSRLSRPCQPTPRRGSSRPRR